MKILSKIFLALALITMLPVIVMVLPGLVLFNLSEAMGKSSRLPEEL